MLPSGSSADAAAVVEARAGTVDGEAVEVCDARGAGVVEAGRPEEGRRRVCATPTSEDDTHKAHARKATRHRESKFFIKLKVGKQ